MGDVYIYIVCVRMMCACSIFIYIHIHSDLKASRKRQYEAENNLRKRDEYVEYVRGHCGMLMYLY